MSCHLPVLLLSFGISFPLPDSRLASCGGNTLIGQAWRQRVDATTRMPGVEGLPGGESCGAGRAWPVVAATR